VNFLPAVESIYRWQGEVEHATEVLAMDDSNNILFGVNYASADYLGLAQHPYAKEAAINAAKEFGLCSGGTPGSLGANK
jgi:glycine C-acetyltransferase